jgi:hypothetical protein
MAQKSYIQLASYVLSNDDDVLQEFLSQLSIRTSLEELLGWDADLADFLVGAWASFPITEDSNQELMVALYTAQLPQDKYEQFSQLLEQWIIDHYNIFVR